MTVATLTASASTTGIPLAPHPALPNRRQLLASAGLAAVASLSAGATTTPDTLRIVSHNVYHGFSRTAAAIRTEWRAWMQSLAADVVSLQELVGYTPETLAADAAAWGHAHSALLKEDGFPVGITARRPLEDVVRLREGFHHGGIRARVGGIWVYAVHLHPSDWHRRILEGEALVRNIAALGPNPRVVLAGDFNGFSPQDRAVYEAAPTLVPFFEQLDRRDPRARNLNAGRLDYRGIEVLLDAGLVDAQARRRQDEHAGFAGTFPTPLVATDDHGPDRRLDYIFLSPALVTGLRDCRVVRDDLTARFSDHYPVVADIDLSASAP